MIYISTSFSLLAHHNEPAQLVGPLLGNPLLLRSEIEQPWMYRVASSNCNVTSTERPTLPMPRWMDGWMLPPPQSQSRRLNDEMTGARRDPGWRCTLLALDPLWLAVCRSSTKNVWEITNYPTEESSSSSSRSWWSAESAGGMEVN